MQPSSSVRLAALAASFFDAWIEAEPEEATTLGLAASGAALRDPGLAAEAATAHRCAAALQELDAIEAAAPLGEDEGLDAWALRAHAAERVRAAETQHASVTLEAAPYALMMLAHAAARATTTDDRHAILRRLEALPDYLEASRAALAVGVGEGRPTPTSVLEVVADQLAGGPADLQAIVDTTFAGQEDDPAHATAREAARRAVAPLQALETYLREVVAHGPGAADVVPLGEAEFDRRLRAFWGLTDRAALARRAWEELAQAREDVVALASRVASDVPGAPRRVLTFTDAKAVLDVALAARAASGEEVLARYAAEIERAAQFCRERGAFTIPKSCHCEVLRAPDLWRNFAPCTNWPAPLLGGDAPGACAVVADPALHPLLNVPGLAVHEAVPGHFLQSRAWQLRFGKERAPVRFLGVPDECGILHGVWIPHFSIEGWAVYAERRMEEAGFHDPASHMFSAFCRCIHATRALTDMGLHTEGWSRAKVAEVFAEGTGMPPGWCARQGVRHARSGLQALAYLLGRLAIEDLAASERARQGGGYDDLDFQSRLLDAGPVPPALLAGRLAAG